MTPQPPIPDGPVPVAAPRKKKENSQLRGSRNADKVDTAKKLGASLSPELKDLVDNLIVPLLIKVYTATDRDSQDAERAA